MMDRNRFRKRKQSFKRALAVLFAFVMICGICSPCGMADMQVYAQEVETDNSVSSEDTATDESVGAAKADTASESDGNEIQGNAATEDVQANTTTEGTAQAAKAAAAEENADVSYLDQISALKAEAEALDGEASDVLADWADIYSRLMTVYEAAAAEKEAGTITAEEYNEIYSATGEVISVLYGYGYDPYAVVTTGTSGTISYYGYVNRTVKFVDTSGNSLSSNKSTYTINEATTLAAVGSNFTIDGYTYSYAAINSVSGTQIVQIRYQYQYPDGGTWQYKTENSSNWTNIDNQTDIYLVYTANSSSGGSSSTTSIRYYHFDIRISASIKIKVLNADGTVSETTITNATISDPTATIYNTGTTEWEDDDADGTSETGIKYKKVSFNKDTGEGSENEYMDSNRSNKFYTGDTLELAYKLTYTYNGKSYTIPLTETRVVVAADNVCTHANDTSGTMRGFDIVVSAENISSAMSASMLQIAKYWDDNNNTEKRPDSITVKVYRTVNSTESLYMTLTLVADVDGEVAEGYTMASGETADEDMKVTFADDYAVTITGLPQNYWVKNSSTNEYEYVSCSYTVKEVQATGDANFSAVYGSFVYVDDTQKDSYIVTITNTLAYEKLAVLKEWADEDEDTHEGDSVQVQLKAYYESGGAETEVPDAWLAEFIGGSTTVTLDSDNDWYAVWGNMPVYYTPDEGGSYPITAFKAEETNVTVDNGETYTAAVSSISTGKDTQGNYYFTVTNTPKPKDTDVTVEKTVSGALGDQTKEFAFEAKVMNGSTQVELEDVTGTDYSVANNIISFTLKHNESVTIQDLPIGSTLWIRETDASDYSATVTPSSIADEDGWYQVEITKDLKISFDNFKDVTPDTGVLLDSIPYILILAIVLAGAAVGFVSKRRSREDD